MLNSWSEYAERRMGVHFPSADSFIKMIKLSANLLSSTVVDLLEYGS